MQVRSTTAWIDREAFRHNLLYLRGLVAPDQFFCPMVKADAYGHSLEILTPTLMQEKVAHLGVALAEEAFALRSYGFTGEILLFGHFSERDWLELNRQKITPVIGHQEQWNIIQKAKLATQFHFKFNLGMTRLGFESGEENRLAEELKQNGHLELEGVCQHWPCGDQAQDPQGICVQQFEPFFNIQKVFSQWPRVRFHVHNSSGLLLSNSPHLNPSVSSLLPYRGLGGRPGIALYGYSSISESIAPSDFGLKPVMTLKSQVILERQIKKGTAVSYGGIFVAPKDMKIGVVEAGYADGVRRNLSNQWKVQVGQHVVSQIGRVCMDYFMVDLTSVQQSALHEEVALFGGADSCFQNAEQLAGQLGTISYEILTGVSSRVPRRLSQ